MAEETADKIGEKESEVKRKLVLENLAKVQERMNHLQAENDLLRNKLAETEKTKSLVVGLCWWDAKLCGRDSDLCGLQDANKSCNNCCRIDVDRLVFVLRRLNLLSEIVDEEVEGAEMKANKAEEELDDVLQEIHEAVLEVIGDEDDAQKYS